MRKSNENINIKEFQEKPQLIINNEDQHKQALPLLPIIPTCEIFNFKIPQIDIPKTINSREMPFWKFIKYGIIDAETNTQIILPLPHPNKRNSKDHLDLFSLVKQFEQS